MVGSSDESGPPPTPFERIGPADRASVAPAPRRGSLRRRMAALLLVLLVAAVGFVGGLVASDHVTLPDGLRSPAVVAAERERALVGLLEDIVGTESIMLVFNDEVDGAFDGTSDREVALDRIARSAGTGAGGLLDRRPRILARSAGTEVVGVREAYVPHLDSWISYLEAVADQPELLLRREDLQPYILRINATAEVFRLALEELLASGPPDAAAELAERILDDGFRSDGPDPTL